MALFSTFWACSLIGAYSFARDSVFLPRRGSMYPTEGNLSPYSAECVEGDSLLKNPSTSLPSTLQGLKNPAIAVFWTWCLSVWTRFWTTDWSYDDFFNKLGSSAKFMSALSPL